MPLISRPERGFVFWPVGTGDSTTVVLTDDVTIQIDLHHMQCSEDPNNPSAAIIDELEAILPRRNGKPYLSLFVLTHPDRDHCKGFGDLLKRITIGEIWHAPRIFREFHKDLCDDAQKFRAEIRRRRALAISQKGNLAAGDRIRVIGWDDILQDEKYRGFPRHLITVPGQAITAFDGDDHAMIFRAFIHGPFKEEFDCERNDTSVAMQINLKRGAVTGSTLLLGDYAYENVYRVFTVTTDKRNLEWDVFLSPHHCSKKAIYNQSDEPKYDILSMIEASGRSNGRIIASSHRFPKVNNPGDNPPHIKARNRYKEILPSGGQFLCTQEHPNITAPKPIVFEVTATSVQYVQPLASSPDTTKYAPNSLAETVNVARGGSQPPAARVGFGQRRRANGTK